MEVYVFPFTIDQNVSALLDLLAKDVRLTLMNVQVNPVITVVPALTLHKDTAASVLEGTLGCNVMTKTVIAIESLHLVQNEQCAEMSQE